MCEEKAGKFFCYARGETREGRRVVEPRSVRVAVALSRKLSMS